MNNQVITIEQTVGAIQNQFEEIANTHKQVVWREESEFALQAFNKNPFLSKCNLATVQTAVKNVATVGLTLNPSHGFAYLVPEYNKATNQQECQLRISFQGLIKLATDSGAIKIVKADVVHEKDTFTYHGSLAMPEHSIGNPFNTQDRGAPIGVYCVAITHEERVICDLMSWDEVMKIKAAAKTSMVWDKWPMEMAKKAIIKRAYKQWPKTEQSKQLVEAVSLMNETEGNKTDEDLKQEFEDYLYNKEPLEFFLFLKSLSEIDYSQLFNSGEKGEKVKLKDKFSSKEKLGSAEALDLLNKVKSDDDETKQDAIEFIEKLPEELKQSLRELMKQ